MYRIAVCDDEAVFLKNIAETTSVIFSSRGIACELCQFVSPANLMDILKDKPDFFDLLLLDILFENANGIKLAKWLRHTGNKTPIIFVTSSPDFLLDGYSVEPAGYVLKPIDRKKLEEALLRAYSKSKRNRIILETSSVTVSFCPEDVLYIEVFNKTSLLHLRDGKVMEVSMPLSALIGKLPDDLFVQCHRCYAVALTAILCIYRYEITLQNNKKIPVGKTFYKTVQLSLQEQMARMF